MNVPFAIEVIWLWSRNKFCKLESQLKEPDSREVRELFSINKYVICVYPEKVFGAMLVIGEDTEHIVVDIGQQ